MQPLVKQVMCICVCMYCLPENGPHGDAPNRGFLVVDSERTRSREWKHNTQKYLLTDNVLEKKTH